ncbi:Glucan endo-1,3-beta-glucosidase 1 [Melia azedarach]|uniref:Glucan endo-1,3-beta-glucosidase 1 n=1 Tax=Melia azedarach TaxID=155640 RepID=A0ACC1YD90_MELAZ|nr:Glucan endo-1,3-beta-glucosidase 1 [Melia azedarach]
MAKPSSNFLFFLLLSLLYISSSGNLVGVSYNARGNNNFAASSTSTTQTVSFLKQNKNESSTQICVSVADQRVLNLTSLYNSTVSVDLYLNLSLVVELLQSESSAISWLETNVLTFHPHVNIKNIILSCSSKEFDGKDVFPLVLSALRSFNSVLDRVHLGMKVKVSVAFPLPLLENLSRFQKVEIRNIFSFVKKTGSLVIIEAGIDEKWSLEDLLVRSLIKKTIKATSVFPDSDFLLALVIQSSLVPSTRDLVELTESVWKFFESIQIGDKVDGFYAEVEKFFPSSLRRGLANQLKKTIHETFNPVNPPENNPTPTIVTVPATNPVTVTPANPENSSPLPIPSTTPVNIPPATPVNIPPAAPVNPAAPITVPGAQPVTNPVTTFPPPAGNVPGTNPVTAPPATTNAPAIPGQSWCVAKQGVSETALQAALDYACGMGGADCSLIQQGGSCYNPNSLQNHASYAFNSYYQKNPSPTSCDFGGVAMTVNTNPSTGSCVYPTSSTQSSTGSTPPAQPNSTTPPATTTPTTPTTMGSPPPGPGISGSVTPPSVLNSSTPGSVFGTDSPPVLNTSTSTSDGSHIRISLIAFVTTLVTGLIVQQGQT